MQIFLYGFFFFFLIIINFLIIKSDFTSKKIPNMLILILLIIGLSYNVGFIFANKEYIIIFYHFLYLFIAFLLYSFGIWSAGDAKYVFALNLFLPETSILIFIGNIAIITILQLGFYALWFYIGKGFFIPGYWKKLTDEIFIERKDHIGAFLKSKKFTFHSFLFYIFLFLLLFIAYRYFRIFFEEYAKNFIDTYNIFIPYFHALFILIFSISIWGIKKIFQVIPIPQVIEKNKIIIEIIISIGIIFILYHQFIKHPVEFQNQLKHILTIGIIFYISFKTIWYLYKLSFITHESTLIDINKLQVGHIIDKGFIIQHLGMQDSLGFENEGKILSPDPKKFFQQMSQKINGENKLLLQECYQILNKSLGKHEQLHMIKILHTFSFGIFIFIGFLVTKFFGNTLILHIIMTISNIIKSH